jgi:hypothetical protein
MGLNGLAEARDPGDLRREEPTTRTGCVTAPTSQRGWAAASRSRPLIQRTDRPAADRPETIGPAAEPEPNGTRALA